MNYMFINPAACCARNQRDRISIKQKPVIRIKPDLVSSDAIIFFSTFKNGGDHANVFFVVLSYCLVSVWVVNRADDMPLEFMKLSTKRN